MKEKYDIGKQMGFIHHMIRRNLEKEIPSDLMKISMANGYILFYLYDNKDKDVYQKDFEENFGITQINGLKNTFPDGDKGTGQERKCGRGCKTEKDNAYRKRGRTSPKDDSHKG